MTEALRNRFLGQGARLWQAFISMVVALLAFDQGVLYAAQISHGQA